jgi:hypothetical protein
VPIATRVLTWRRADGEKDVPVRLFRPEPDDRAWICRYEIAWPDTTFASAAYGRDAVQALVHALQKIAIELYVSEAHRSGRFGWVEPGAGYGFPLVRTVRDLAVGHDREFF